jgi:hypothetical protein
MKDFLSNLNGWQRIFIFIVTLIYLPITVIAIANVESVYQYKYSDIQINQQITDFIQSEKIKSSVTIKKQNPFDKFARADDLPIPNKTELLKLGIVQVEFISTHNKEIYIAEFEYKNGQEKFNDDPEILKIANLIQEIINKNEFQNKTYIEILEIILYFSLTAFLTYFVGFMIGWVIKGFKQSKG